MRKRYLILLALFCLFFLTITLTGVEAAPGAVWSWNLPDEATTIFSVKETSDGGYIAAGNARSNKKGKPHGVYLVKVSKDGKKVWHKWWGRTDIDGIYHTGYDVIETDDGNYVLTGKIIPPDHIDRLLVIKVDAKGSQIWERMVASPLGRGYSASGSAVLQTSDKGFIIAGHNTRNFKAPKREGSLIFPYLLKLDKNGEILWEKTFFEENPPSGSIDSKGFYIFKDAGRANTLSSGSYPSDWMVQFARANKGGYFLAFTVDILGASHDKEMTRLIRLDENGSLVWERSVKNEIGLTASVTGITATLDDGVAITGFTYTTNLKQVGEYELSYLIKFDAAGNAQWKRYFGTSGNGGSPGSVQQTLDGGYIICGRSEGNNAMVVKFDGNGKILWDRLIGNPGNILYAYDIRQTSDRGYITAITKSTPRFLSSLLKLDGDGNMKEKYSTGKIKIME